MGQDDGRTQIAEVDMYMANQGIYKVESVMVARYRQSRAVRAVRGELWGSAVGSCGRMTRAFRGLARASAGCGHQLHLAGSWMLQGVRPTV